MSDVQTADPGRKIQNRYSITGTPPIFTVSNEIQPVVLLDSLAGPIQVDIGGVGGFDPLDALFERPCAGFRNQLAGWLRGGNGGGGGWIDGWRGQLSR